MNNYREDLLSKRNHIAQLPETTLHDPDGILVEGHTDGRYIYVLHDDFSPFIKRETEKFDPQSLFVMIDPEITR